MKKLVAILIGIALALQIGLGLGTLASPPATALAGDSSPIGDIKP